MKKLIIFNLLFVSTLFASCNTSSNHYWIDNPTDAPITVYIDDTVYDIPAMTKIDIDLEYGKHQLKYNGQELTFHNGGRTNKGQAIINPTQSTYVFMAHKFINQNDERATDKFVEWALKTQSDSLRLKINDTITTLFVPFKATNQLFLSKSDYNWDYNIEEPMPEGITLSNPIVTRQNRSLLNDPNYQAGKFQETLFKLYREQEFKDFIKQYSNEKIEFLLEKTPYAELPKRKIALTKLKDITDAEYQQKLEGQVKLFDQWLDLNGSQSTEGFKEVLLSQELNTIKADFLKKYPKNYSFNQATNEFNTQKQPFMQYQLNIIDDKQ
ncbi:hypothetical protein VSO92_05425 [Myroides pelagicus]|uniref:hypothetical protein n=1 Tax=Myroides pelagicus TaxID=270914 RepID=UPI002DBC4144|nr:hypothetical protein [Myroides pelagicus]MEC4113547.1 hypothetical protein [Myroides pelagicus]